MISSSCSKNFRAKRAMDRCYFCQKSSLCPKHQVFQELQEKCDRNHNVNENKICKSCERIDEIISELDFQLCLLCLSEFRNEKLLDQHIKSEHNQNPAHTCYLCQGNFGSLSLLRSHFDICKLGS